MGAAERTSTLQHYLTVIAPLQLPYQFTAIDGKMAGGPIRLRDISGYLILLIVITTLGSLQFGFHLVPPPPASACPLTMTSC